MSVPAHRSARRRVMLRLAALAVAATTALGLVAAGTALAERHGPATAKKSAAPAITSKQIPNLGLVEDKIEAYYGDHVAPDGTHQASANSDYAKEVRGVEAKALSALPREPVASKNAVIFDVDDTTLLTYNYEAAVDFGYDPTSNAAYVLGEKFPAVFGMNILANRLASRGYAIFWITGRPHNQAAATLGNLSKDGYPAPTDGADGLFTKPDSGQPFPSYVNCNTDGNPACSTTEYKSSTRAHIASMGYKIDANFGDQFSDLNGGHSGLHVKMPNPMYFLP